MRVQPLLCLAVLAGTTASMAAQAVNDVDPNATPGPQAIGGGNARGFGDVVAGPFDVETTPFDNRCLGVEHAWSHYWVTGRGHSTIGDNWMIHKYDENGVYIASYAQNLSVGYAGWGGRDMEADEAANKLWQGTDFGEVGELDYDPISGGLTASTVYTTSVVGTVRALCRNPNTGNYFTKSFTGDISEFDLATGAVINTFVNTGVSAYGMAWDYAQNTLWANDTSNEMHELDPATGLETGRSFFGLAGSPGGLDLYDDARNANTTTLVGLSQTTPDSIECYDATGSPPPPPPAWPNLPTSFVSAAGMSETFESHAGVVPSHMAINALNALTGVDDPEAWCNIGQQGLPGTGGASGGGTSSQPPHEGAYCLEMGLDPLSTNYHDVRNGLIMGLNGAGAGTLTMDFWVIDHGEETDTWDGIWVSEDGLNWESVYGSWNPLPLAWQQETGIDLSATSVSTDGDFYLLFAQDDNFPMGYLDGIQIDEIDITGTVTGPLLELQNLVAGQVANLKVSNATPGGLVRVGWSTTGAGPTGSPWGDVMLSAPINVLAGVANGAGEYLENQNVPSGTTGVNLWLHGLDVASGTLTNPLATTIG